MTVPGPRRAVDVDAVTALVERVAADVVTPRFRALRTDQVGAKGADDVVTVVDHEAEAALTDGLGAILPGVPVVGEEGVAADRSVLDALAAPHAWVVDPLDGTQAFVDGSPEHAVMVALVAEGVPVAGWIHLPALGATYVAERGAGAWADGVRLDAPAVGSPEPAGAVAVWAMDARLREAVERVTAESVPGTSGLGRCLRPSRLWAGYEYGRLATTGHDYLCWWRASPWDHSAGAVLVREVGGVTRHLDGGEYTAQPLGGPLLVARDEATWGRLAPVLTGLLAA